MELFVFSNFQHTCSEQRGNQEITGLCLSFFAYDDEAEKRKQEEAIDGAAITTDMVMMRMTKNEGIRQSNRRHPTTAEMAPLPTTKTTTMLSRVTLFFI